LSYPRKNTNWLLMRVGRNRQGVVQMKRFNEITIITKGQSVITYCGGNCLDAINRNLVYGVRDILKFSTKDNIWIKKGDGFIENRGDIYFDAGNKYIYVGAHNNEIAAIADDFTLQLKEVRLR
jgi:hypothetical protein